ncbi:YccF domain-containing protein [Halorientalis pallida]|uniref:YccF domain-containing protein n=1 Tax=Halorientalis pallida TaxID=2479928 RepID=A0A498KX96_9EURY|nr:YccF domain-containing protein [Halorientalis pallida]RXK49475.1 YccF domain-containing protein [Halorientalis pallida]
MVTNQVSQSVGQRSLLVRAAWFLLIGWWATGIWMGVAWLLNVTIVGIPLGIKMINQVPTVVSLKRRPGTLVASADEIRTQHREQRSLLVRAVWFLLIGWWASGIWMGVAYLLTVSIVGLPVAVWMYDRLPAVVSLYRY